MCRQIKQHIVYNFYVLNKSSRIFLFIFTKSNICIIKITRNLPVKVGSVFRFVPMFSLLFHFHMKTVFQFHHNLLQEDNHVVHSCRGSRAVHSAASARMSWRSPRRLSFLRPNCSTSALSSKLLSICF